MLPDALPQVYQLGLKRLRRYRAVEHDPVLVPARDQNIICVLKALYQSREWPGVTELDFCSIMTSDMDMKGPGKIFYMFWNIDDMVTHMDIRTINTHSMPQPDFKPIFDRYEQFYAAQALRTKLPRVLVELCGDYISL